MYNRGGSLIFNEKYSIRKQEVRCGYRKEAKGAAAAERPDSGGSGLQERADKGLFFSFVEEPDNPQYCDAGGHPGSPGQQSV